MMTEDGVPSVNPKLDAIGEMLKTIHDLDERNKVFEKQLTKAKELLKRCYENYIYLEPLRSELEQFLREAET